MREAERLSRRAAEMSAETQRRAAVTVAAEAAKQVRSPLVCNRSLSIASPLVCWWNVFIYDVFVVGSRSGLTRVLGVETKRRAAVTVAAEAA